MTQEKQIDRRTQWRLDNPERVKARAAEYYAKNKDILLAKNAAWVAANKERRQAQQKQWREANREKRKAEFQEKYKANPEKYKAIAAKWRAENPERVKEIVRKSALANPEAVRIVHANRRARKKAAQGKISQGLSARLFALQKGVCPCCRQPLGEDAQLDHIVPLARGGSNTDDNMQLLRKRCNIQKGAKHPVEFMQSRGFLL